MVVEQHAAMRFAWLRETSGDPVRAQRGVQNPSDLITVAYNLIWWVPIILPLAKAIDYRTGFVAFLAITVFRAIANFIRNNLLPPEQGERFPLRGP